MIVSAPVRWTTDHSNSFASISSLEGTGYRSGSSLLTASVSTDVELTDCNSQGQDGALVSTDHSLQTSSASSFGAAYRPSATGSVPPLLAGAASTDTEFVSSFRAFQLVCVSHRQAGSDICKRPLRNASPNVSKSLSQTPRQRALSDGLYNEAL